MDSTIKEIKAREVLDSRGFPTVQCDVTLCSGDVGSAIVPSGASTGQYEAVELRDNDNRFCGKGVKNAVDNINNIIAPALLGRCSMEQPEIDGLMLRMDYTDNKSKLGANATLAVSIAVAKAASKYLKLPLYRYLGNPFVNRMPVPMMNILNGGKHASNNIDIQEFMIMPTGAKNFSEGLRQCCEIYHSLKDILKSLGKSTAVGDEGGFAPDLDSDEQAIEVILKAIKKAGYSEKDTKIALDAAASEWYENGGYTLPKRNVIKSTDELIAYFDGLCAKYPIVSVEDPLSENDWQGFTKITEKLGSKVQIVGDDLFVTNEKRLKQGIDSGAANSILIKVNQIGTLTETFAAIERAHRAGYTSVISHRSGESEDTTIADIAVAVSSGQIKTGAPCRSERTAKYNRLLKIEEDLAEIAEYSF
ncbi:MAG: phosphopyruvate hydratase [Ruminococcaceae bacterium]|nr:phosphopyruvate hydratase [Oscillospiraceae bacterium]